MDASSAIAASGRLVIKVGSVLVTDAASGTPRQEWLDALAADISALVKAGKEVILVTSGAIALGRRAMGISGGVSPSSIRLDQKQAAAAVGQFELFSAYHRAFLKYDQIVAQILLTAFETENRRMHLNARATLQALMEQGIVPIINENDTISTGDIRLGDNDKLAARVAQMTEADLLILLSTTHGLYTGDPSLNPDARHIPLVEKITDEYMGMAGDAVAGLSTGGMKSKLEAASAVTQAGTGMIIAKGVDPHPVARLAKGESLCTLFIAHDTPANARKRWIAGHVKPKGTIVIDDGALAALRSGKSLLPVGVKSVSGIFERGDAVKICTGKGQLVAIGLSAYGSGEAAMIVGKHSAELEDVLGYGGRNELVHRDDMVLQGAAAGG